MKRFWAFSTLTFAAVAGAILAAASAHAQEFTPPRFEGLEQQQLNQEQRAFDALEERRQDEIARSALPGPDNTPAQSALRRLELEQVARELQLDRDRRREQATRETAIREATLPNRRIAAHSSLVVSDPAAYALPAAPEGQYYARLEGRFVLVDESSELVVKVLDILPGDPRGDLPPRPLPGLQRPNAQSLSGPAPNPVSSPHESAISAPACISSTEASCTGGRLPPLSDTGSTSERR